MTTNDRDGLPKELIEQLLKSKPSRINLIDKILSILPADEPGMSIDDLLIAFWKDTGTVKKRSSISAQLSNLFKAGVVKRVGPGVYIKNDKDLS